MFRFLARLFAGLLGLILWFPAALFDAVWDRWTGRDLAPEIRAEEREADIEVAQHDLEYDALQREIAVEEAKRADALAQERHDVERQRIAELRYHQAQQADRHDADVEMDEEEALSFAP